MNSRTILPLFLVLLPLFGCATVNQRHYEDPLYNMQVLAKNADDRERLTEITPGELANQTPGQRPPADSDEAGLWMAMDKAEKEVQTAGNRVDDAKLTAYLHGIACRISPEYCNDLRIYVQRVPYFNAAMAPNGVLIIWSGLLVRATNEAQVAGVIGHEIAHYLRRHSLQRMRDTIAAANTMIFVQLATAAAGVGIAGDLATLAAIGTLQAYSRDQEREADGYGLALMARAGYDPQDAASLWQGIIREMAASDDKKFSTLLFDGHPPETERLAALDGLANRIKARGGDFDRGAARYRGQLAPWRFGFLQDELLQRDFARAEVLLSQLIADDFAVGELRYFQGEMYRLRGQTGDTERALAAFEHAAAARDGCPPETFRALGLLYRKQGEMAKARTALEKYLTQKPEAMDREMIRHMVEKEMP